MWDISCRYKEITGMVGVIIDIKKRWDNYCTVVVPMKKRHSLSLKGSKKRLDFAYASGVPSCFIKFTNRLV